MSLLNVVPDSVTAAAGNVQDIGAAIKNANAVAAARTTAIAAPAADEVSAAITALFGTKAQAFQAVSAKVAAFHDQFVQLLNGGAAEYLSTESANVQQMLVNAVNMPTQALLGHPLIGTGHWTAGAAAANPAAGFLNKLFGWLPPDPLFKTTDLPPVSKPDGYGGTVTIQSSKFGLNPDFFVNKATGGLGKTIFPYIDRAFGENVAEAWSNNVFNSLGLPLESWLDDHPLVQTVGITDTDSSGNITNSGLGLKVLGVGASYQTGSLGSSLVCTLNGPLGSELSADAGPGPSLGGSISGPLGFGVSTTQGVTWNNSYLSNLSNAFTDSGSSNFGLGPSIAITSDVVGPWGADGIQQDVTGVFDFGAGPFAVQVGSFSGMSAADMYGGMASVNATAFGIRESGSVYSSNGGAPQFSFSVDVPAVTGLLQDFAPYLP